MANLFLRAFAGLSLPWNHRIGSLIGTLVYRLDSIYARRMRDNLAASRIATSPAQFQTILRQNITESGKTITEVLVAWLCPPEEVAALVQEQKGWEYVEQAQRRGRGIIFVTPHLGCFDIAGRYIHTRTPVTTMYRQSKLAWVEKLMKEGRERMGAVMATADMSGVRTLLKTLKQGGNILMLPDQVPSKGDGVWANFFGRPAYTMTLLGRLQQATNAEILMFFGERLPNGTGYRLWIEPLAEPLSANTQQAAEQINAAVENLIRQCPSQYLWSYNRYKTPAGAMEKLST